MANSPKTSARRFERIVKKIVREDVELQSFDEQFFIDKEVFNSYLPEMKDVIEDSSLSDFLLKYDLSIHTTELVKYFNPQSSTKRDFVNLKYLSGKYGPHLCYMALRESNSSDNENGEIVRQMKCTAISLNKKPPSDLFTDSLPFPSHSSPPIVNNDSSRDELSGQGELTTIERKLADIKLEGHSDPLSFTDCDNEQMQDDSSQRRSVSIHHQFAFHQHMTSCKCTICISAGRSPLPEPTERTEQAVGTEEIEMIGLTETNIQETTDYAEEKTGKDIETHKPTMRIQRQFSAPHLVACTCMMCINAKSRVEPSIDSTVPKNGLIQLVDAREIMRDITSYKQFSAPHLGSCTCNMCNRVRKATVHSGSEIDFSGIIKKSQSAMAFPLQFGAIQESGQELSRVVEFGTKNPLSYTTSFDYSTAYGGVPWEIRRDSMDEELNKSSRMHNLSSERKSDSNLSIVSEEDSSLQNHQLSNNAREYSHFEQETNYGMQLSVLATTPSSVHSYDSGKPTSHNHSSLIVAVTANTKQ